MGKAEELMDENHYRQLPVIEKKQLIGIVSDRDIRSFLAQSSLLKPEERARALRTKVNEIMTAKLRHFRLRTISAKRLNC